jgi:hypothetical protein
MQKESGKTENGSMFAIWIVEPPAEQNEGKYPKLKMFRKEIDKL